jgi:cell division protein FtsL
MSKFTNLFKKFHRKTASHRGTAVTKNLPFLLGAVALILGVFYLVQVNQSATRSFSVHALVQKEASLQTEHRNLELQQAELSALSNLEESSVVASLVPSVNPEFLNAGTADVARR